MCPSYMATREEKHSTRGRAQLLWEMMEGNVIKDGWRNEEVKEALDLCLSCKACKTECPVNVDMATWKAEFLAHHYEGRLHPLHHYAFGFMDRWANLASLRPSGQSSDANAGHQQADEVRRSASPSSANFQGLRAKNFRDQFNRTAQSPQQDRRTGVALARHLEQLLSPAGAHVCGEGARRGGNQRAGSQEAYLLRPAAVRLRLPR